MQNSQHLPVGYKIGNIYEIIKAPNQNEDILGQGGFGIVYLVKDKENRFFVIKELFLWNYSLRYRDSFKVGTPTKNGAKDTFDKVKKDVVHEINILSSIENRNIVKAYGYIKENNTIYSIMEYIKGTNLEDCIAFSEKEAIELLQQIIYGLKEIHEQKIIHRDIKPSNIMKADDNLYKLIDFTTSKTYSSNKTTITDIRSKGYAPPELEQTRAIIGRYSDIYSIGMTLFNLLSQKKPPFPIDRFSDETSFQENINALNISDKFKAIIRKMTAMKIEDRFQNLQEIEDELNIEVLISENSQYLPIGHKIGGHYEIIEILGQGGFGIVYLIKDTHLVKNNIFIIKELFIREYSYRKVNNLTVFLKKIQKNLLKK